MRHPAHVARSGSGPVLLQPGAVPSGCSDRKERSSSIGPHRWALNSSSSSAEPTVLGSYFPGLLHGTTRSENGIDFEPSDVSLLVSVQIPLTSDTRCVVLIENRTEDWLFRRTRRPLPRARIPHQSQFRGPGGPPQRERLAYEGLPLEQGVARSLERTYTVRTCFLPNNLKIARHTGNTTHIRSVVTDEAPKTDKPRTQLLTHPRRSCEDAHHNPCASARARVGNGGFRRVFRRCTRPPSGRSALSAHWPRPLWPALGDAGHSYVQGSSTARRPPRYAGSRQREPSSCSRKDAGGRCTTHTAQEVRPVSPCAALG